jgi:pyruvate dehydrogenase E2 component (dihydrolipoamide acetyltransferase)
MSRAWSAPQVAIGVEVDLSAALKRRALLGTAQVNVTHLVLRAVALTLAEHPALNGTVDEAGAPRPAERVNLGLAVALEDGLLVPVIDDADRRSLVDLAAAAREAAELARDGRLSPASMQGGTFTVSTLGATGIDWFTPILNPPQIAILGVGCVAERAVVRDGAVQATPTATLVLVFDHRAVDGMPAARFLAALRARLEEDASSL